MKMIRTAEDIKLITDVYEGKREFLVRFITNRIQDVADAEDMSQDVFLRLLEMQDMICRETADGFIFAIARNMITDYLRKKRRVEDLQSCLYEEARLVDDGGVESQLLTREIRLAERGKVRNFPLQRRNIYCWVRYKNKPVTEIAMELNLSVRTVEKHLYLARRDIRSHLRKVGCVG